MVTAACASGAATPSAPARMPVGVPAPVNASLAVASTGYDGGAEVLAFSVWSSPTEAARAYAATLKEAAFVAAGTEGAWQYFRGATALIAYETGSTGPPTDLVVRVMARDAPVPQNAERIFGEPTGSSPTTAAGSTAAADDNGSSGGTVHAAQTPVPQPDPPHGNPNSGNGNAGGNGNETALAHYKAAPGRRTSMPFCGACAM